MAKKKPKSKPKSNVLYIGLAIAAVILIVYGLFTMSGTETPIDEDKEEERECPASCDDGVLYTKDTCSAATGYECENEIIAGMCGNTLCEEDIGENKFTCPTDCKPKSCTEKAECFDADPCTRDTCTQGFCANAPIYGECRTDPCEVDSECDDNLTCTRDRCIDGFCDNYLISNCIPLPEELERFR